MKADKVCVRRHWDWYGTTQVELEYEDGTVDSMSTMQFEDFKRTGCLVEVERFDD